MKKLQIYVCCHKPCEVKNNDVYTPLHVGRAQSRFKEEMKDMIGDDTGDNISTKNPQYSEATGIYWIWKNVHDVEYVGLCHYRRYFDYDFTSQNIDSLFDDGTEVILTRRALCLHTKWNVMLQYAQTEDLLIIRGAIKKLYPEFLPTLNQYWKGFMAYNYNMVVCRKELYDKYAEWLLSICLEYEKHYKPSSYSNAKRIIGYMAEMLTPVFFIHNNCKIKELPFSLEGRKSSKHPLHHRVLMSLLQNTLWRKIKNTKPIIDESIYRGMEADGIDLDFRG